VLNAITQRAHSSEFELTIQAVLEQLTRISRAEAAWFRILEGDQLVLAGHHGVSPEFVAATRTIASGRSVSGYALRAGEVCIVLTKEAAPEFRKSLKDQGFHHILLVPVEGKGSRIGTLTLGFPHFRLHTENEKAFLKAAAKQLGLAAENRQLARQVVQSRS